jgi:hypothetical protein
MNLEYPLNKLEGYNYKSDLSILMKLFLCTCRKKVDLIVHKSGDKYGKPMIQEDISNYLKLSKTEVKRIFKSLTHKKVPALLVYKNWKRTVLSF